MTRQWLALSSAAAFEAALRTRPAARSEHFFVHRVPPHAAARKLSTSQGQTMAIVVDDFQSQPVVPSLMGLGLMVPKRHAKRAVTRNLVKRQIRAAFDRHLPHLPHADWVVRLRAPIDVAQYPSARSEALARALRAELDGLLMPLVRVSVPVSGPVPGPEASC